MVNEISNGLSNGKRSEAMESDVGVRVEVGMCEAESSGMHITHVHIVPKTLTPSTLAMCLLI